MVSERTIASVTRPGSIKSALVHPDPPPLAGMLPPYSDQTSPAQRSLARLAKTENLLGSRPLLRWVFLGCISIGLLVVFTQPFSLSPSEFDVQPDLQYPPPHPPPRPPRPPVQPVTEDDRPGPPTPPSTGAKDQKWDLRKTEVKDMFLHAWKGYMDKGFPDDEVKPVSGGTTNK